MKTLDEVIDAMERCSIPHYFDCKGCPYEDDDAEVGCRSDDRDADALHYLNAYRQLSRGLVSENTEIRPEGIYCKVCGTRLDKDLDDEDA